MEPRAPSCPRCGAPVRTESTHCQHCHTRLATVACPSCFGMLFLGTRFCPHCGAEANRTELSSDLERVRQCPRCAVPVNPVAVGETTLEECPDCDGLWVGKSAFEKLCADKEKQGVVLGSASLAGTGPLQSAKDIRYIPCPDCRKLMNRVNFANCSGVIVDVCREHGTWFDRDELARIVEFIRSGGLDISRERRQAELAREEQRLRRLRAGAALDNSGNEPQFRGAAVFAAQDLLRVFLR